MTKESLNFASLIGQEEVQGYLTANFRDTTFRRIADVVGSKSYYTIKMPHYEENAGVWHLTTPDAIGAALLDLEAKDLLHQKTSVLSMSVSPVSAIFASPIETETVQIEDGIYSLSIEGPGNGKVGIWKGRFELTEDFDIGESQNGDASPGYINSIRVGMLETTDITFNEETRELEGLSSLKDTPDYIPIGMVEIVRIAWAYVQALNSLELGLLRTNFPVTWVREAKFRRVAPKPVFEKSLHVASKLKSAELLRYGKNAKPFLETVYGFDVAGKDKTDFEGEVSCALSLSNLPPERLDGFTQYDKGRTRYV